MSDIRNLSEVVLDALSLFAKEGLPDFEIEDKGCTLVVGSGNALETGKILFDGKQIVLAGEDQYQRILNNTSVDGAVVISASGEKHAPVIVSDLVKRNIPTTLLTCRGDSSAAKALKEIDEGRVIETPSNPEPITYNTSTYMGMMLARTREDPTKIRAAIINEIDPIIPDMTGYNAFYLMLRPEFDLERQMFITKFDELFGPLINGRCYTVDQTLHAKTVIESETELFISFGLENPDFGLPDCRLHIPLRPNAGHAEMMGVGYYVIGKLQSQLPPWFKNAAPGYGIKQKALFEKWGG